MRLELLEEDGTLIREFLPKPGGGEDDEEEWLTEDPRQLTVEPGLNRMVWDLRYPGAERFPGMVLWNRGLEGPRAVPGTYRAKLTVGEWSAEVPFEVLADPRGSATAEDFRLQFEFLQGVTAKLTQTHQAIARLRTVRDQVEALHQRLSEEGHGELIEASKSFLEALETVEKALYQTQNRSAQDPLNFPIRLNDRLAGLLGLAAMGDARPTESMLAVRDERVGAIDTELERLDKLLGEDLPALDAQAREAGVPVLGVPPEED